jgi:glycosyltransferase involved in cell wall biosynthesis
MARIGVDARLTYYRRGGISQYIEHLIHFFAALDVENQYFILQSRRDQRNLATAPNQHRVPCWTPAHNRFERLALAVEVFPLWLDLLHSPDFIPPLGGRYRSVITVHDLTFLHYPTFLTPDSRRYYNDQIEAAVARADHIIADSEATRVDAINLLDVPSEKITAILLAADEQFRPAPPEEIARIRAIYHLPSEYLLFVGTLEPRKNLGGLLRAYALLSTRLADTPPLIMAGQRGWLYDEIFDLIEQLKLSGRVSWVENVPYPDLPALYSGASLLCLPSFYEGFGLPPLEAMACGTPVVVSNRASLPEVVGDAGILVDPDDTASIADALYRVLADSALAALLRQRGLARAALFTWQETAKQTLAVYWRVLEQT